MSSTFDHGGTCRRHTTGLQWGVRGRATSTTPKVSHSYNTLIRPILKYAHTVWDPHTATNFYQLEAKQRRAARFVKGENRTTSSTNAMTTDLGWPTLLYCRSNTNLFMLYTITHDLKVIPAAQFSHSWHGGHGYGHRVHVPVCRN